MPNPMTTRQKILERRQRLEDVESSTRQELQRLERERAALDAELAAEDQAAAEAAQLAAKSGLPVDVARARIAKERGGPETTDTAKMSREQYLEYRRDKHGF